MKKGPPPSGAGLFFCHGRVPDDRPGSLPVGGSEQDEAGVSQNPIDVPLVDDHPVVRDGISAMLSTVAHINVCGTAKGRT